MNFAVSTDHRVKKKQKTGSSQKADKAMEYEGDRNTNHSWNIWNNSKEPEKESEGTENQWKEDGNPDHSIVEIG